jgi:hypothetical protein
MIKKELCPNCGSKKFHEYPDLLSYYHCDNCNEEMILEDGQFYLCDPATGEPEGDALKVKVFVFR